MNFLNKASFTILAVLAFAVTANAKIRVVTTTTMITDLVANVGGEEIELSGLMGPGVDPHLYKPTAGDILEVSKAKVIFYNGLHLEGKMTEVFEKMERRGVKATALAETLDASELLSPEDFDKAYDPHIWFDPELWAMCVPVVAEKLAEVDPANAALYKERAKNLADEYLALKTWGETQIAAIPAEDRILVTSHDAFNYFGNAFDFKVIGVQGISTVSEAGLADISQMTALIKAEGVKAIFVESSVSPAAIQRVARDAGVKVGGELFSDAMGVPGDIHEHEGERYDAGTYVGMFKHNVTTIVSALKD